MKLTSSGFLFRVAYLVTDNHNAGNKTKELALRYGIEYFPWDYKRFLTRHSQPGAQTRNDYFKAITKVLMSARPPIDCVVLANFDLIVPRSFIDAFGDRVLSLHQDNHRTHDGKVVYTGINPVHDLILKGERGMASVVHIVTPAVDQGQALAHSQAVSVDLYGTSLSELKTDKIRFDEVVARNRERLELAGDVEVYPKVVQAIALGRFARDRSGNYYFDGKKIPVEGLGVEELTRGAGGEI